MITLSDEQVKEIIRLAQDAGCSYFSKEGFYNYIKKTSPNDNLTLSIKATKESLKKILLGLPDIFIAGQIHYSILEEVFEELGWEEDPDSFDHNGWEHDTWFDVTIPDKAIGYHIYCSWADPRLTMEKFSLKDKQ